MSSKRSIRMKQYFIKKRKKIQKVSTISVRVDSSINVINTHNYTVSTSLITIFHGNPKCSVIYYRNFYTKIHQVKNFKLSDSDQHSLTKKLAIDTEQLVNTRYIKSPSSFSFPIATIFEIAQ